MKKINVIKLQSYSIRVIDLHYSLSLAGVNTPPSRIRVIKENNCIEFHNRHDISLTVTVTSRHNLKITRYNSDGDVTLIKNTLFLKSMSRPFFDIDAV